MTVLRQFSSEHIAAGPLQKMWRKLMSKIGNNAVGFSAARAERPRGGYAEKHVARAATSSSRLSRRHHSQEAQAESDL
jgi:hypothetical protein